MKPVILLVEDNLQILTTLKLMLELNHYHPVVATNGKHGLKMLAEMNQLPDIIISDIMMPDMDGYEFFKIISENPNWFQIPFIFLTARAAPEDVRLGKMLGVDDYLTKPFQEEDLLAAIAGKLLKKEKSNAIIDKFGQAFDSLAVKPSPSDTEEEKELIALFWVLWDEEVGPILQTHYPEDFDLPILINDLGVQLFQTTVSIYGYLHYEEAQDLLLTIKNIHRNGYLYFDSYPDSEVRGSLRQYMLAVISPQIKYFDSLRLKNIFQEISVYIKRSEAWDIEKYWKQVSKILSK